MNDLLIRRKMFAMGSIIGIAFGLMCLLTKNPTDIIIAGISVSGLISIIIVLSEEKKDAALLIAPIPFLVIIVLSFSPTEKEAIEKIYLFGKFFLGSLICFSILVFIIKSRLANLKKT